MPPARCGLLGSLEGYTRSGDAVHRSEPAVADRRDRPVVRGDLCAGPRASGPGAAQRTRTDRQVTQPSSFSNSEMSTVTTR
jgi:hypothetical protein